jgi:salicylate hydroxylase
MHQILESVREIREIGAAVHLAPNAHRLIKEWGGELIEQYGSVVCTGYHEWTADGELKLGSSFDVKAGYGNEWVRLAYRSRHTDSGLSSIKQVLCHRVDVQEVLRKLAVEENGRNPPAKLVLQTKIVDVVRFKESPSCTCKTKKLVGTRRTQRQAQ